MATDPYKIFYAEGLAYLSGQVNAGVSYSGKHFLLTRGIDLKGRNWKPIGRRDSYFAIQQKIIELAKEHMVSTDATII